MYEKAEKLEESFNHVAYCDKDEKSKEAADGGIRSPDRDTNDFVTVQSLRILSLSSVMVRENS
jgi:hypothetical protein